MQDVVTARSRGTIQILFPEYRCLRVAIVCTRFGEIKRKFLSLSAQRDNFSQYDSEVGVHNPKNGK